VIQAMPDWLIVHLASLQAGVMRTLAAELRAGGLGTSVLAFSLGALHALTPGHGKSALAAYFLGTDAPIGKGVRVALTAALLHVLSGLAVFLVLRLLLGQLPSITGRPSPAFTVVGYGLIIVAGTVMLVQSLRPNRVAGDGGRALTAGVGLLPCPLTISVLGFAWAQGSAAMIGLVLISLAIGVATTIGSVAVLAIAARSTMGAALAGRLPRLERGARYLQTVAALAIIAIGIYTLWPLRP
jgi:ABC-type nickel/cobalt efflux system permease component RcnA